MLYVCLCHVCRCWFAAKPGTGIATAIVRARCFPHLIAQFSYGINLSLAAEITVFVIKPAHAVPVILVEHVGPVIGVIVRAPLTYRRPGPITHDLGSGSGHTAYSLMMVEIVIVGPRTTCTGTIIVIRWLLMPIRRKQHLTFLVVHYYYTRFEPCFEGLDVAPQFIPGGSVVGLKDIFHVFGSGRLDGTDLLLDCV